jgi:predicted MFS family arabinose efflux permease
LQLTGSGLAAGMVLLCSSLPFFLLIPVAGPIVDRYNRKTVMIIANLAGAGLALVFLLVRDAGSLWIMYAGMILLVASAAFFNPAAMAVVPNIVSPRQLYSANVLSGSTWAVMVMVGSALGGLVSAQFGRELVFGLNSLSFLVSTALIWRVNIPKQAEQEQRNQVAYSTWGDFIAGLVYLGRHKPVLALAACKAGWGLGGGVLVLLSVFSRDIFKTGDDGIGLLYAGRGLGALLGPFLIRPLVGTDAARMRLAICLAYGIQATGYLIFAFSSGVGIWLATVAVMLGHCGGGITWAGSSVLLQKTVPDKFRGRVFAIDLGLSTLTSSLSTLVWSLALQFGASPVAMALLAVGVFFLFGLFWTYLTSLPAFQTKA